MPKVFKICIASKSDDDLKDLNAIELEANKGIINDRYYSANSDKDVQLTLIQKENIDYYNEISDLQIPYINFRRNIITSGIALNNLIGKNLMIGNIKIKAHRLCDPCKYLQEKLNDEKLVKKLVNKGGLRCEILSSGKISVNDEILTL